MSDFDDDDMMCGSDMEEEEDQEAGVDIENQYYEAKDLLEESPKSALEGFENVVLLEEERGKWGFKALKRIMKILFKLGKFDEVLEKYKQWMAYTRKAVPMNESEKAIHSLLNHVSSNPVVYELYEITARTLQDSKNDKALLRLQLKLAKLLQQKREYDRLEQHLQNLRQLLMADQREDPLKASQLTEVLALEITMHTERGNIRKLKELYEKAKNVKSAINSLDITGVIFECGGKMYMREQNWSAAYTEFFQAFKDYCEGGNSKALACLKYLVLANMLGSSDINPFLDTRAKSYQTRPEIQAMLNLVNAYQNSDIHSFNQILEKSGNLILDDDLMKQYIPSLLTNIRSKAMVKLIGPYTRIRLQFISTELNIPLPEVRNLLVSLILDSEIQGSIDQVNGLLELTSATSKQSSKYKVINKLSTQLVSLQNSVFSHLS